jgi:hypothetical protein
MNKFFFTLVLVLACAGAFAQNSASCACCHEKAKQFHFWVGDWETYSAGKLVGTNRIVLMEDNCVMQENWKATGSPYTGTSYNFYNTSTGKWQQLWVDNQGGSLQLEGEWSGAAMILKSKEEKNQKGQLQTDRITWTPNVDGSVRQLWETSVDGEKTWSAAFDGLYKKVKK